MTAHTPGPWVFDVELWTVTGPHCVEVADVTSVDDLPCLDEDERPAVQAECRANAHLVAAAPELLEALQRILFITDRKHVAWDAAHAAIAKATGGGK